MKTKKVVQFSNNSNITPPTYKTTYLSSLVVVINPQSLSIGLTTTNFTYTFLVSQHLIVFSFGEVNTLLSPAGFSLSNQNP